MHRLKKLFTLFVVGFASFAISITSADSAHAELGGSTLRLGDHGDVPVLRMQVHVEVSGFVARTYLVQEFENPTEEWVEGIYLFPLPDRAAVDALKLVVGGRVTEGQIRPREVAQQEYEEAARTGRKAALVEQQRPNLFTTRVANIGPGERIEIWLEYQEELAYRDGGYRLAFPMTLTPRYASQEMDPEIHTQITNARPGPNPVSISVALDSGFPLTDLFSPSHEIQSIEVERALYEISLLEGSVPADRDFVLEWRHDVRTEPAVATYLEEHNGAYYALFVVAPPLLELDRYEVTPRELVFVIDSSGSMRGPPSRVRSAH